MLAGTVQASTLQTYICPDLHQLFYSYFPLLYRSCHCLPNGLLLFQSMQQLAWSVKGHLDSKPWDALLLLLLSSGSGWILGYGLLSGERLMCVLCHVTTLIFLVVWSWIRSWGILSMLLFWNWLLDQMESRNGIWIPALLSYERKHAWVFSVNVMFAFPLFTAPKGWWVLHPTVGR